MLIILFLASHFIFLFVPCGRLSWLPVSFLLHVKYPLSYRIVRGSTKIDTLSLTSFDPMLSGHSDLLFFKLTDYRY